MATRFGQPANISNSPSDPSEQRQDQQRSDSPVPDEPFPSSDTDRQSTPGSRPTTEDVERIAELIRDARPLQRPPNLALCAAGPEPLYHSRAMARPLQRQAHVGHSERNGQFRRAGTQNVVPSNCCCHYFTAMRNATQNRQPDFYTIQPFPQYYPDRRYVYQPSIQVGSALKPTRVLHVLPNGRFSEHYPSVEACRVHQHSKTADTSTASGNVKRLIKHLAKAEMVKYTFVENLVVTTHTWGFPRLAFICICQIIQLYRWCSTGLPIKFACLTRFLSRAMNFDQVSRFVSRMQPWEDDEHYGVQYRIYSHDDFDSSILQQIGGSFYVRHPKALHLAVNDLKGAASQRHVYRVGNGGHVTLAFGVHNSVAIKVVFGLTIFSILTTLLLTCIVLITRLRYSQREEHNLIGAIITGRQQFGNADKEKSPYVITPTKRIARQLFAFEKLPKQIECEPADIATFLLFLAENYETPSGIMFCPVHPSARLVPRSRTKFDDVLLPQYRLHPSLQKLIMPIEFAEIAENESEADAVEGDFDAKNNRLPVESEQRQSGSSKRISSVERKNLHDLNLKTTSTRKLKWPHS